MKEPFAPKISNKKDRKSASKVEEDEGELEDDGILDCGECGKKCKGGMAGLKKHLETVHGKDEMEVEDLLDCTKCGKKCKSIAGLTNHMRMFHATSKACEECEKVLPNSTSYKLHMEGHDRTRREQGTEASICKVCKKVFVSKAAFDIHSKSHLKRSESPEKPKPSPKKGKFECTLCKKIFKSSDSLKNHQKVDHAKDQFCFTCEIDFIFKSKLKIHFSRKHKDEKLHYESSSEETESEEEKEGNLECTFCNLKNLSDLATHFESIHNIRKQFLFYC